MSELPVIITGPGGDYQQEYPPCKRERELLTQSSLRTFRECHRKYLFRYEIGLSRIEEFAYFGFGRAFHKGRKLLGQGHTADEAADGSVEGFNGSEYDRESVRELVRGAGHRYASDTLRIVRTELAFRVPLVNPDTGAKSRTYDLAGRIDAIVQPDENTNAVGEYKTAGEDIGPESDYWLRLRCDAQISVYMIAARELGYDPATVVYDVTRKPTIAPRQITVVDECGDAIVLDASGDRVFTKQGKPRKTSDTAAGYVLQTRQETAAEFGTRLRADIAERPDYYYQRREVPRLDSELDECRLELWQQSQLLLECRRRGLWFRNVTRGCSQCEFAGPCLNNVQVDAEHIPSGFVRLDNVHPELTEGAQ